MSGSVRERVGLTSVLRVAARTFLYAIQDLADPSVFRVGVEKSNMLSRNFHYEYVKGPRIATIDGFEYSTFGVDEGVRREGGISAVEQQQLERVRVQRGDGRSSGVKPKVDQYLRENDTITRTVVAEFFADEGSSNPDRSADALVGRWIEDGRFERVSKGVYRYGRRGLVLRQQRWGAQT
jgi:hypothetical protein